MTENRFKFTLKRIEKLEPGAVRTRYYDTENLGLMIEVLPSGRKVFRTSKRNGITGAIHNVTIGPFPSVTVDMAIKRHSQLIAEIIKGNDPNEAKREAKRKGIKFCDLYELYIKDFAAKVKRDERRASSQIQNDRIYKNHLSLILDSKRRRLSDITLEQIDANYAAKTIENLKSEKTQPVFNKCLTLLKSMFNLTRDLLKQRPLNFSLGQ